jgi:hypothetical protein
MRTQPHMFMVATRTLVLEQLGTNPLCQTELDVNHASHYKCLSTHGLEPHSQVITAS